MIQIHSDLFYNGGLFSVGIKIEKNITLKKKYIYELTIMFIKLTILNF